MLILETKGATKCFAMDLLASLNRDVDHMDLTGRYQPTDVGMALWMSTQPASHDGTTR